MTYDISDITPYNEALFVRGANGQTASLNLDTLQKATKKHETPPQPQTNLQSQRTSIVEFFFARYLPWAVRPQNFAKGSPTVSQDSLIPVLSRLPGGARTELEQNSCDRPRMVQNKSYIQIHTCELPRKIRYKYSHPNYPPWSRMIDEVISVKSNNSNAELGKTAALPKKYNDKFNYENFSEVKHARTTKNGATIFLFDIPEFENQSQQAYFDTEY